MKKKLLFCILTVCILIAVFVGVRISAADEMSAEIISKTLSLNDTIKIVYYVDFRNAPSGAEKGILVWKTPQASYTYGTQDEKITEVFGTGTAKGISCTTYAYSGLYARNMTDDVYTVPYIKDGNTVVYGQPLKYSILRYAVNMMAKDTTSNDLKNLLREMLEYGAAAQIYKNYKTDTLATDTYRVITVENGILSDGTNEGIYKAGTTVTLTAVMPEGETFNHWEDQNGNVAGTTETLSVTVTMENMTYTATSAALPVKEELEYETNGDGTCGVIGIGTFTGTALVIPETSPDGDKVISIDASAFAGESIVSVSIPKTVKEIGKKAFNGCTALTDVYYDGSEEDWNDVMVGSYNTPLDNAVMHFSKTVQTYTVTFKDSDGIVLKQESVESGKSATPPVNPQKQGYTFTGWSGSYQNITSDTTVIAQYAVQSTTPTLSAGTVTATAGSTETVVTVSIKNNPGLLTLALNIEYDSDVLTLTKARNGSAFADYSFTAPKNKASGCTASWYITDLPDSVEDGEVLLLTFTVSDTAPKGTYDIRISCPDDGGTVNGNKQAVSFSNTVGHVTVN